MRIENRVSNRKVFLVIDQKNISVQGFEVEIKIIAKGVKDGIMFTWLTSVLASLVVIRMDLKSVSDWPKFLFDWLTQITKGRACELWTTTSWMSFNQKCKYLISFLVILIARVWICAIEWNRVSHLTKRRQFLLTGFAISLFFSADAFVLGMKCP